MKRAATAPRQHVIRRPLPPKSQRGQRPAIPGRTSWGFGCCRPGRSGRRPARGARTARIRSIRYVRIASARCAWHSRYQRPYRTMTAHGSTSASRSSSLSPLCVTRTRRRSATAANRALVVAGAGRATRRSGVAEMYARSAAACRPTLSGRARMTALSAERRADRVVASIAAGCPSSTAMTRLSACSRVKTTGGSRVPWSSQPEEQRSLTAPPTRDGPTSSSCSTGCPHSRRGPPATPKNQCRSVTGSAGS